jgi:ApeA N-terminal domain 1/Apea-like HEPN
VVDTYSGLCAAEVQYSDPATFNDLLDFEPVVKMPAYMLEEHGLFWWSDEVVPVNQFVPEACVGGVLRINEDGRTELELDSVLPHEHGPFAVFSHLGKDKSICGKLKTSNRYVWLSELTRNGGSLRSSGISFEKYAAWHTLVGHDTLQPNDRPLRFWKMQVELKGFEEWLWLRSIETKRTERTIRIKYTEPGKISYPLDESRLAMVYDISGPMRGKGRSSDLKLKELARLEYVPRKAAAIADYKAQYGLLSDLFILLTGSDYALDWPVLVRREGRKVTAWQFIFARNSTAASEPPKIHDCWTNFPKVKDRFGDIFATFRKKREELGSGIYLYLGTQRAERMYEEHRFVNLIWGLESFHRRRAGESEQPNDFKVKINRILGDVKKSRDRKWLQRHLENAHEPALADRMFEILKAVPLGIDAAALRKFCAECAVRRNDISHFGGLRKGGDYAAFIIDLDKRSNALSYLYHAFLLQEIGVETAIIQWYVDKGFRSFAIKSALIDVWLLPPSVPKPGE